MDPPARDFAEDVQQEDEEEAEVAEDEEDEGEDIDVASAVVGQAGVVIVGLEDAGDKELRKIRVTLRLQCYNLVVNISTIT